ncbi:hypothetical protein C1H46_037225 [Malus baccata]|uniref:Uncharacterized protein n=1 Tax=Malus baccata TaxID=106549 RepID=A0A540KSN3_MALBA|nr:hypothetical protein C1H46_037225 [Malus baccata]
MHEAKKKGYQSVADMLRVEKLQKKENGDSKDGKGRMHVASDKATSFDSPSKRGKENALDQSEDVNSDAAKAGEMMETCNDSGDDAAAAAVNDDDAKAARGRRRVKERQFDSREVVLKLPLPQGTPLTTVAGVKLAAEDVGNALQFLKFFKIEKSQAQSVLWELSHGGSGRNGRPGQYSSVVRFHSYMLFFIQKGLLQETLRGWIEEQKERSVQCKRDMKVKVALAKDKERDIQAKLQEQMAKRATPENGDAVPISESDSIASVLRSEAAQAHTEVVKTMAMVPQSNEICEALRIEPYIVDADGHAFWKLKGDFAGHILLQD